MSMVERVLPELVVLAIVGARELARAGRLTAVQRAAIAAALAELDPGRAAPGGSGVAVGELPRVCGGCGGVLAAVDRRRRRYCSHACRSRGWRSRRRDALAGGVTPA